MWSRARKGSSRRCRLLARASTTVAAPDPVPTRTQHQPLAHLGGGVAVDPVISEEHAVTAADQYPAKAEDPVAISVVRRRRSGQPLVAVAGGAWVLARFDQAHVRMCGHERANEGAARLRSENDRRPLLVKASEGRPHRLKQRRVSPPPGDVRPGGFLRAIGAPGKGVDQSSR